MGGISKAVVGVDELSGKAYHYPSMKDAGLAVGLCWTSISKCCRKVRSVIKVGGLIWFYEDDMGWSRMRREIIEGSYSGHSVRRLYKRDLRGCRFGELVVLRHIDDKPLSVRGSLWLCRCSCGREVLVGSKYLNEGRVRDCGCVSGRVRNRYLVREGKAKEAFSNFEINI